MNTFYIIIKRIKVKKLLLMVGLLFTLMNTIIAQTDTTITTFNKVHQGWGSGLDTRTVVDTFIFPSDISVFATINLNITCACPIGGCDPWDRFANLKIIHEGEAYEIARYMTPYGKACSWSVNITDYRSMLTDTVILSSFVDTWVNPAWSISYDFEFIAGNPAYKHVKVENLWTNENVVYGDTTKPIELDSVYAYVDRVSEETIIRVINTGHGQGNTDNAAEFSQKTHKIYVDDVNLYSHLLWRSDCGSNPTCSNQSGTWKYNRANWCPGKAVDVEDFDITSNVSPGSGIKVEYELEEYFNYCSPNTNACVKGTTCSDCNYNYNGHTEPHYKIHIQLLQRSNDSEVLINNITELSSDLQVMLYPNPSNNELNISSSDRLDEVIIFSVVGEQLLSYRNQKKLNIERLPTGVYLIGIRSGNKNTIKKFFKY